MKVYEEKMDDKRGMINIRDVLKYIKSKERKKERRRKKEKYEEKEVEKKLDMRRIDMEKKIGEINIMRKVMLVKK